MQAPEKILELVKQFELHEGKYTDPKYNEASVRSEFIEPMFVALGWDLNNSKGKSEQYREVVREDVVRIGGRSKFADYAFRCGRQPVFFVEAKKPSIDIFEDPASAYQIRSYAWNADLPVSILTNFKQFAVYAVPSSPKKGDKASKDRVLALNYTEYPKRWDEIASLFTLDAIVKDSLEQYVSQKRRSVETVDKAFLADMERWRMQLARNIALRNRGISQRELNYAVQATIDRIIFLRICEDRDIEPEEQLKRLTKDPNIYKNLCVLYERADERYNSGLFHFRNETNRKGSPDTLTPGLHIDDKELKALINSLYDPCPYNFAMIPVEILGQAYERFLGSVIRVTGGGQARVEEKPEVRKAGGVYYTPQYIVDYIVEHTIGKLIRNKSPQQVSGDPRKRANGKLPISVLDPSCGSGSFLVRAYRFLLDWHLDYYTTHSQTHAEHSANPVIYRNRTGEYRLSLNERKRILLANIHGVDIDAQAVEVTKLSLLLCTLEGEDSNTIQQELFHARALPDLDNNIKCGNSLIGTDFYLGQMDLDEEERYKVNAFDWDREFPEIMKAGGFDAIIGNPPYIPIEMMTRETREYYASRHPQLERKYDSSIVFILSMLKMMNTKGRLGYISSVTWQTGVNYRRLREFIFKQSGVDKIVNLPFDVFKNAYVDTGIYLLTREPNTSYHIHRFRKKERITDLSSVEYKTIPNDLITPPDYRVVLDDVAQTILHRCVARSLLVPLGNITKSTQGLAPSRYNRNANSNNAGWYPFMEQGQVYRYSLQVDEVSFVDMTEHRSLTCFYDAQEKLLIRRVINRQDRLMAALGQSKMVYKKDINPFIATDARINMRALLGVINSTLLSYLYVNTSTIATKDDFRQTTLAELRGLPVPYLDDSLPDTERLESLVNRMLDLRKRLQSTKLDQDRTMIQRQIDGTDAEINRIVYSLYGLTKEEIEIVESSLK